MTSFNRLAGDAIIYPRPAVRVIGVRAATLLLLSIVLPIGSIRMRADTGMCAGASITIPFTDVSATNIFFCSIAAAYFAGLTNGTSATTYSPGEAVPREQMAAFVSRTLTQLLRRGSPRAALNQWWTPTVFPLYSKTQLGASPLLVASDGDDLWVANNNSDTVTRVRASDGKVVQTWSGAQQADGVLVTQGAVYVTGDTGPVGRLYALFPATPGNNPPVSTTLEGLGGAPHGIAFDGILVWTANSAGSVSIVQVEDRVVTNVSTGFVTLVGILYDGANIWVTDFGDDQLKKLNANGTIALSVPVGDGPYHPVFDGTNIWVPSRNSHTLTVVRVKDTQGNPLAQPFVLATLNGNGLNDPLAAAFDGQRILVTNLGGNSVSLWKAADLTPLGSVSTGGSSFPKGACSDGFSFWVTLGGPGQLLRF